MFSVVIPLFNEEQNISPLIDEITYYCKNYSNYEIILVNDASTDETFNKINNLKTDKIKIINNSKKMGQSFSISKAIENSNFNTVVTLDGDGQNDPKDIPYLLKNYLSDADIQLIGGIRHHRQDSSFKIISSKIANLLRSKFLNDDCKDTGCALKVFNKDIFLLFPYFNGIHRFLPALYKGYGYKTKFINVHHRKRKYGVSKYGTINRLFRGIRDMYKVYNIIKKYKK